jgi:hypothetical protein
MESQRIDRYLQESADNAKSLGVRSIEDKNWGEVTLSADSVFVHGSKTGPVQIETSGGLSPQFGKERILINGHLSQGKYLLAFFVKGKSVPPLAGPPKSPAKVLWAPDEFMYLYVFRVKANTKVYQAGVSGENAEAQEKTETGFPNAVPWESIVAVFQYDHNTRKYVKNIIKNEAVMTMNESGEDD